MYEPKWRFNPETQNYEGMGTSLESIRHDILMTFAKDNEDKVRKVLISMGWLPPAEAIAAERALADAVDAAVRKGVAVHWEPLTEKLVKAHDAIANLKS